MVLGPSWQFCHQNCVKYILYCCFVKSLLQNHFSWFKASWNYFLFSLLSSMMEDPMQVFVRLVPLHHLITVLHCSRQTAFKQTTGHLQHSRIHMLSKRSTQRLLIPRKMHQLLSRGVVNLSLAAGVLCLIMMMNHLLTLRRRYLQHCLSLCRLLIPLKNHRSTL